jgi:hypothetical protein
MHDSYYLLDFIDNDTMIASCKFLKLLSGVSLLLLEGHSCGTKTIHVAAFRSQCAKFILIGSQHGLGSQVMRQLEGLQAVAQIEEPKKS